MDLPEKWIWQKMDSPGKWIHQKKMDLAVII